MFKKMTFVLLLIVCLSYLLLVCKKTEPLYKADWESLKTYPIAEWFKDAKFGIYFHWGVYGVPAYGHEWYPRKMYNKEEDIFKHHAEKYGHDKVGYVDFIPQFTGEKFDAEEWAELFKKAGARFAGPVAIHHDGFAMWDSDITEWDAMDKGPKRDITGEIAKAVKARGMKLITSFHHAYNWKYYEFSYEGEYDTKDPKNIGLYPEVHEAGAPESESFLRDWEAKIEEVIDKYQPDFLWFDFGWKEEPFESYKKSMISYYYNAASEWGRDVVVSYKDDHLPEGVGVLDYERGRADQMRKDTWLTDTAVDYKSWGYIADPDYKPLNTLIDVLVDIVSKNGNMLLSLSPRPDGAIPQEQQDQLIGIGEWLKVNGEAIYDTRSWEVYGEGPTQMAKGGGFSELKAFKYTAEDIRFTTKDKVLYAICLDWPGEKVTIKSFTQLPEANIQSIQMLGSEGTLEWSQTTEGLTIQCPSEKPCDHAYAFKITLK